MMAIIRQGANIHMVAPQRLPEKDPTLTLIRHANAVCSVLDVVIDKTVLPNKRPAMLLLLDRGARQLCRCPELPDYAKCFIQQREPIRLSVVVFLHCCKKSAMLAHSLDRGMRNLLGRMMWDMRFNV